MVKAEVVVGPCACDRVRVDVEVDRVGGVRGGVEVDVDVHPLACDVGEGVKVGCGRVDGLRERGGGRVEGHRGRRVVVESSDDVGDLPVGNRELCGLDGKVVPALTEVAGLRDVVAVRVFLDTHARPVVSARRGAGLKGKTLQRLPDVDLSVLHLCDREGEGVAGGDADVQVVVDGAGGVGERARHGNAVAERDRDGKRHVGRDVKRATRSSDGEREGVGPAAQPGDRALVDVDGAGKLGGKGAALVKVDGERAVCALGARNGIIVEVGSRGVKLGQRSLRDSKGDTRPGRGERVGHRNGEKHVLFREHSLGRLDSRGRRLFLQHQLGVGNRRDHRVERVVDRNRPVRHGRQSDIVDRPVGSRVLAHTLDRVGTLGAPRRNGAPHNVHRRNLVGQPGRRHTVNRDSQRVHSRSRT